MKLSTFENSQPRRDDPSLFYDTLFNLLMVRLTKWSDYDFPKVAHEELSIDELCILSAEKIPVTNTSIHVPSTITKILDASQIFSEIFFQVLLGGS